MSLVKARKATAGRPAPGRSVVDHAQPDWGVGVVTQWRGAVAWVFFNAGGRRSYVDGNGLSLVDMPPDPLLEAARAAGPRAWSRADRSVYVIGLRPEVRQSKRFREANPGLAADAACLYVGLTARAPEERFAQHKAGIKDNVFVRRHGTALLPEHYAHYNPVPYVVGVVLEPMLARWLRRRGFGVWQN